ncbi:hypothetical protein PI124_g5252 [Phytophthora idaei]|nr:hypothetical protein PI126_g20064 [Phytophthora idaei]KAG3250140.1 hypothetical protein PI124_g5252 [Phytophthora idaei]
MLQTRWSRVEPGLMLLMLKMGASIDLQHSDGNTALGIACDQGHVEIVKILLENGARIDIINNAGATSLTASSSKGTGMPIRVHLRTLLGRH